MSDAHRLSESRFTTVQCEYELKDVKTDGADGDFNTSSLSAVVNTQETNELTVRTWIARAGRFAISLFPAYAPN